MPPVTRVSQSVVSQATNIDLNDVYNRIQDRNRSIDMTMKDLDIFTSKISAFQAQLVDLKNQNVSDQAIIDAAAAVSAYPDALAPVVEVNPINPIDISPTPITQ